MGLQTGSLYEQNILLHLLFPVSQAMFLLPFYSILEHSGDFVRREELGDWELPNPAPILMQDGEPTDSAFQRPYTKAELEAVEHMIS